MSIKHVITRGLLGSGSIIFVPTRGYGAYTPTIVVPNSIGPTLNERVLLEQTTGVFYAYVRDEEGVVIPLASLTTLTLTLYDKASGTLIRNAEDAKNAHNVTVHATSGLLTWSIQTTDTTLTNTALAAGELEEHRFLFTWTFDSGNKTGRKEDWFAVQAVEGVS